jgi:hypothetical protein
VVLVMAILVTVAMEVTVSFIFGPDFKEYSKAVVDAKTTVKITNTAKARLFAFIDDHTSYVFD